MNQQLKSFGLDHCVTNGLGHDLIAGADQAQQVYVNALRIRSAVWPSQSGMLTGSLVV